MRGKEVRGYRITEELGSGGMGVVYLAVHPVLERRAVVKVLRAKLSPDPDLAKRFINEAKAAAAINHPGIVDIIDVDRLDDGQLYILMEHLDGESLRERLTRTKRVSVDKALSIIRQAAGALDAAHHIGIVHRDLKPDNMFLVPDPEVRGGERVKLLDFGIAKLSQQVATEVARTHTGAVMGTPVYMSPEQCGDSANVDARTDLYALGCILFELVCGRPPFVHTTSGELIAAHLRDTPPVPSALVPSATPPIDALVAALLAKDAKDRPASAAELVERIDRIGREASPDGIGREASPDVSGTETMASQQGVTRTLAPAADPATEDTLAPSSDRGVPRSTLSDAAAQVIDQPGARRWYRRPWLGWAAGGAIVVAALAIILARRVADDVGGADDGPASVTPVVERLTRSAGVSLYPSLSTDGERLVYTDMTDILLRRVQGERATNLTEDFEAPAIEPAFSLDGEQIAFSGGGDIYVMGASGENKRRIATGGYWPAWSPDGAYLVYTSIDTNDIMTHRDESGELWRVDVASGERLLLAGAHENARQPSWSPDGKRIAFVGERGIMTVRPDGTDLREAGISYAWQPVWDHESRGCYLLRDRSGQFEIFWYPVDSVTGRSQGEQRVVLPLGRTLLRQFAVANQGKRWVGAVHQAAYVVFAVALDPKTNKTTSLPKPISDRETYLMSPTLSPDGARIAYASYQMKEDMFVSRADGSELEKITDGPEYRRGPSWSPKGDRIAFGGTVHNQPGIWTIGPDGSGVTRISPGGADSFRRPHFSRDASQLAVTVELEDGQQPAIIDLSEPWPAQIEVQRSEGLRGWRAGPWSPTGAWIALTSESGIARLNVATRRLEVLTDFGSDAAWLSESKLIIGDGKRLVLFDVRGATATDLVDLSPWRLTTQESLDISPDRATIYVGALLEEASLYLTDLVEAAPQPR